MIEQKRQADFAEQEQSEWEAWKANKSQAEQEGKLATEADYEWLRGQFRETISKIPAPAKKDVRKSGHSGPGVMAVADGDKQESDKNQPTGSADV